MLAQLKALLATPGTGFMPHGMCLSWQPGVLWLNVIADGLIALAYFSIPFALLVFVRRRKDLEFRWVFLLFAGFIFWCAMTHVMSIWVVWNPDFAMQGVVKLMTAIVSLGTAAAIWPLIPKALALPSPSRLRELNTALEAANTDLETRFQSRTDELQRSYTQLQSVVDALPVALAHFDSTGRLTLWNDAYERLFAQFAGRTLEVGERQDDIVRACFVGEGFTGHALETEVQRTIDELENASVQLGGKDFVVRQSNTFDQGVIMTAVDISDQKVAERNLQDLFDHAPTAMLMVDGNGIIQLANQQVQLLLGYEQEMLLGLNVDKLLPESARNNHSSQRQAYQRSPAPRPVGEGRDLYALHKKGHLVPVEIALTPIDTSAAQTTIAALVDITERKAALAAQEARAEALAHANQDLEQFAYVASHDLQEPIRTMSTFADLLRRRYEADLDEQAKTYLAFIVEGGVRMKQLIGDLLSYARSGATERQYETIALSSLIDNIKKDLAASVKNLKATIAAEDLPSVVTDRSQLTQVLRNLIGNALKYHGESPPQVTLRATRSDGHWVISVADNGIGIPIEYKTRIFELFRRLHGRNEYSGTGIGLAICTRIVQRWGGRIWVESVPGEGATFFFTLPDLPIDDSDVISSTINPS